VIAVIFARRFGAPKWRGLATWVIAAACGLSTGITLGVDLTALARFRDRVDRVVDRTAIATPARFALIGYPDQLDAPLTLRVSRDVEYLDLLELKDWTDARDPILWWLAKHRPVFGVFPPGTVPESPWSDLEFEEVDPAIGLVEIRPHPPEILRYPNSSDPFESD
jgi:hypothetical protein